ncbi:MAG: HAMP domain-containing histidine kinase [Desulfobacteraceae bacterium]|nr:HAMP domain-containing histidine kinase [Desulfobacteraceae bacterium]
MQEESMRQARLASIGELSAGVAHEINNPLNCIIGYAQILADRAAKESEESDLAGRIMKDSMRIETIVKSLLSFAREKKREKMSCRYSGHTFRNLMSDAGSSEKDRISVNTDIPGNPLNIKANAQQIQQVFLNLISNARYALNMKYPESDPDKVLEIKSEKVKKDGMGIIRIMFWDRGTGIAADISDRVCEPFFTTKPPNKGTGLGLSISHGIILDHQGKLWFESVQGEYTKAFVELPEGK